jgi:hypothetical protein
MSAKVAGMRKSKVSTSTCKVSTSRLWCWCLRNFHCMLTQYGFSFTTKVPSEYRAIVEERNWTYLCKNRAFNVYNVGTIIKGNIKFDQYW